MKDNIKISIPTPCPQKWSSFTKTKQGGFCASCQKEVIDFTTWSDDQVKAYFKSGSGKTCGRFRADQLKMYSYDSGSHLRLRWVSFSLAGLLLFFTSKQLSAQSNPKQTTEQYLPEEDVQKTHGAIPSNVTILGLVESPQDREVMPGVNVILKGTTIGTTTDAEGKFSLPIPDSILSPTLVFTFIGYMTEEYRIDVARPGRKIVVEMMPDLMTLGDIVVRRFSPRRLWWRIKSWF
jgi:hypothetical protein